MERSRLPMTTDIPSLKALASDRGLPSNMVVPLQELVGCGLHAIPKEVEKVIGQFQVRPGPYEDEGPFAVR